MLINRRALLVGSALVAAAGCSTPAEQSTPVPPPGPSPAQQTELSLLTLYTAVIAAHPSLASELGVIRAQHEDHLRALGGSPDDADERAPMIARTPSAAVDQCIQAESRAANAHQSQCMSSPSEMARLLTLMSASESSHIPALRNLR